MTSRSALESRARRSNDSMPTPDIIAPEMVRGPRRPDQSENSGTQILQRLLAEVRAELFPDPHHVSMPRDCDPAPVEETPDEPSPLEDA